MTNCEKSKLISLRVETDVLRRLQALATKQDKGYQSLLKQFVIERLIEEEKSEGSMALEQRNDGLLDAAGPWTYRN